ncbi:MAG TPA: DUF885 family protein [archaeon]|nr:DUF885 family protein [archaeon]
MKAEIYRLIDEILDFLWKENPVEATLAGIHRYDDRLEKLDLVSRKNKLRQKKEYVELIDSLPKSVSSSAELSLLRNALEVGVMMEESLQSLDRDAGTYPRLALYGVYQLIARSSAPYNYRAMRAIDRMREIPRILAEGKLNLSYGENIPRLWTQAAVELTVAGKEYLVQLIDRLVLEVPDLENVVKKYSQTVQGAFDEYLEFLLEEILPRSGNTFGVGAEVFEYLTSREHRLATDADTLRRLALEEIKLAEEELARLASKMEGRPGWQKSLAALDTEKPEGDLVAHWTRIIAEVKLAVQKADLLTLPAGDRLVIMPTPAFERFTIPVAGYIEAPPFEEKSRAFFCVTPLAGDPEARETEASLSLHSRPKALLTVIRELYPGRHTLLTRRKRKRPRLAYLSRGNILEEGWCHYVMGLAVEQGWFEDKRLELLVLHGRLAAAWRVLVDLDLHNKGLSESRAVSLLANGVGITQRQAWLQVRNLALYPTSSLGAMIGRVRILDLRETYRQAAGKNFSLKKFHDTLLRLSTQPLDRLERRLLRAIKQGRN